MNFSWKIDPFDSKILGLNAAKITSIETVSDIKPLVDDLRKSDVDYAVFRFQSSRVDLAQGLEKSEFILVDGSIELETVLQKSKSESESLDNASLEDLPRLAEICKRAFNGSRFFNDPEISKSKARSVYSSWIKNSINGYADQVLIYKINKLIAGFVTLKTNRIDLIAVDPEYQGLGIGKKLVKSALKFLENKGFVKISIETQIQNIPAIRIYEGCGFRTVETYLTYRMLLKK